MALESTPRSFAISKIRLANCCSVELELGPQHDASDHDPAGTAGPPNSTLSKDVRGTSLGILTLLAVRRRRHSAAPEDRSRRGLARLACGGCATFGEELGGQLGLYLGLGGLLFLVLLLLGRDFLGLDLSLIHISEPT